MFASEVKAILAYRGETARLSLPALMEYMTFQNVLGERDPVRGHHDDAGGHDGTSRRRWDDAAPDATSTRSRSRATRPPIPTSIVVELEAVLQRAVDRQLMSDVPLGAYLSGGMDSASLVAAGRPADPAHPHLHGGL